VGHFGIRRRRRLGVLHFVGVAAAASPPAAAHAHAQRQQQGHDDNDTRDDGPVGRVAVFPLGHTLLERGQGLFRGPGAGLVLWVVMDVGLTVSGQRVRAMAQTENGHLVRVGPLDDAPASAVSARRPGLEQIGSARHVEPGQAARDGQLGRVQIVDLCVFGHVQIDQVGHDAQCRVSSQVTAPELQHSQSDGRLQLPHVRHRVSVQL